MERDVSDGQYARGLGRSHCLAAIVTLIGWIAGHGTAAFHILLVWRHRGHTVRELQAQEGDYRHKNEESFHHQPKINSDSLRRGSRRKDTSLAHPRKCQLSNTARIFAEHFLNIRPQWGYFSATEEAVTLTKQIKIGLREQVRVN
jgi:hypothetical protein